jgi:hypothetical protein
VPRRVDCEDFHDRLDLDDRAEHCLPGGSPNPFAGDRSVRRPAPKEAIIYLPGMGPGDGTDERALALCAKLALALDESLKDIPAKFEVTARVERPRPELGTAGLFVASITATGSRSDEVPILDVYKMAYRDQLVPDYETYTPLRRLLLTGTIGFATAIRTVRAIVFSNRIGGIRMSQVLMAMSMESVVVFYFAILLLSLIGMVGDAVRGGNADWGVVKELGGPTATEAVVRAAAVSAALLSFLLPNKVVTWLAGFAADVVRMATYIGIDERRQAIVDRVHAVLEHVVEQVDSASGQATYRKVHVVGYCFGTIIALDALFPRASRIDDVAEPSRPRHSVPGRLKHVDLLLTIASPADFIRSLWPSYYADRSGHPGAPSTWLNVYCPADALGSNFRDDSVPGPPTMKIADRFPDKNITYGRRTLSPLDVLTLFALRSHGMYFGEGGTEVGCLRVLAQEGFSAPASAPERSAQ